MAGAIFGNINTWHLSTHTLLCLLVPLESCRSLRKSCETLSRHLQFLQLLSLLICELRLLALTLLLLVAELHHRLLLDNGWFNRWHINVDRGHRWFCGLREPLLLGDLDVLHALLVLLLPQQQGVLSDGLVLDRIVLLLLLRVAQSASGVESKFYMFYSFYLLYTTYTRSPFGRSHRGKSLRAFLFQAARSSLRGPWCSRAV